MIKQFLNFISLYVYVFLVQVNRIKMCFLRKVIFSNDHMYCAICINVSIANFSDESPYQGRV